MPPTKEQLKDIVEVSWVMGGFREAAFGLPGVVPGAFNRLTVYADGEKTSPPGDGVNVFIDVSKAAGEGEKYAYTDRKTGLLMNTYSGSFRVEPKEWENAGQFAALLGVYFTSVIEKLRDCEPVPFGRSG